MLYRLVTMDVRLAATGETIAETLQDAVAKGVTEQTVLVAPGQDALDVVTQVREDLAAAFGS